MYLAAKCCKLASAPGLAARLFDIFAQCSHATRSAAGAEAAVRAWRQAGRAFGEAKEPKMAARAYQRAGKWKLAAVAYEGNGDFTMAALLHEEHGQLWTATRIMLRGSTRDERNGDEALRSFMLKHKEQKDVVSEIVDHYKTVHTDSLHAQVLLFFPLLVQPLFCVNCDWSARPPSDT